MSETRASHPAHQSAHPSAAHPSRRSVLCPAGVVPATPWPKTKGRAPVLALAHFTPAPAKHDRPRH